MPSSFLATAEFEKIVAHCSSVTQQEVGGLLIGRLTTEDVEVEASLPALKASAGSANVTFTHEVWDEALNEINLNYPELQIVGWYHSHPGFGIFLSGYDQFIQENFFSDPRMIAVVIDPLEGTGGTFRHVDGGLKEVESFEVPKVMNRERQIHKQQAENQNRRLTGVLMGSATAVLALVIGFTIGGGFGSKTSMIASPPVTTTPAIPVCRFPIISGDTYWGIAQRYLGSGNRHSEIQSLNDSKKLNPGDHVIVPCQEN